MFDSYDKAILQQLVQDELQRIENGNKVFASIEQTRQVRGDLTRLLDKLTDTEA